jgi:hypothetical protein
LTNPDDVERPGEDEEEEAEQEAGEHVAGHRVRHHQTPRARRHGRTHTAQAATCQQTHTQHQLICILLPSPHPRAHSNDAHQYFIRRSNTLYKLIKTRYSWRQMKKKGINI